MLAGAALALAATLTTLVVVSGRGGEEPDDAAVAEVALPEGPARAGGVVVAEPVADLGRVPLNFAVQHVFHLVNTGTEPVTLGRPCVTTLDGC